MRNQELLMREPALALVMGALDEQGSNVGFGDDYGYGFSAFDPSMNHSIVQGLLSHIVTIIDRMCHMPMLRRHLLLKNSNMMMNLKLVMVMATGLALLRHLLHQWHRIPLYHILLHIQDILAYIMVCITVIMLLDIGRCRIRRVRCRVRCF
jgi:hypothetical protein